MISTEISKLQQVSNQEILDTVSQLKDLNMSLFLLVSNFKSNDVENHTANEIRNYAINFLAQTETVLNKKYEERKKNIVVDYFVFKYIDSLNPENRISNCIDYLAKYEDFSAPSLEWFFADMVRYQLLDEYMNLNSIPKMEVQKLIDKINKDKDLHDQICPDKF